MAKKEFRYYGKTIGELKKIELKELAKLMPSRQRRKILREFTEAEKTFLKKVEKTNQGKYKKMIKTHCRDMIVLPNMIGLTMKIHKGGKKKDEGKDTAYVTVNITEEMIGHYLGEFSMTRKSVKHSAPGIGATRSSASMSVK